MNQDYIVRATAADHSIRAFAITSKGIVETARQRHNTSPVVTAALGRLLTGAAMMGVMMKGDEDLLTVQIKAGGPMQGMTVTADSHGNVIHLGERILLTNFWSISLTISSLLEAQR